MELSVILNHLLFSKKLIGDSLSTEIQDNVKEYFKNINGKTLLYIDALKDGEWIEKNIEFYNFVKPDYIILDDITIDKNMKKWWNNGGIIFQKDILVLIL